MVETASMKYKEPDFVPGRLCGEQVLK